jgi:hypothetical protein
MLQLIEIRAQEEYKVLFNKINSHSPSNQVLIILENLNNINNGCKCSFKRRLNHCNNLIKNYINLIDSELHAFLKREYETQNFKFLDLT